jgi:hypothetical protein
VNFIDHWDGNDKKLDFDALERDGAVLVDRGAPSFLSYQVSFYLFNSRINAFSLTIYLTILYSNAIWDKHWTGGLICGSLPKFEDIIFI